MPRSFTWLALPALLVLIPWPAAAKPTQEVSDAKVKSALPELEKLARQALKQTGVPGLAIAVVHNDRPVYLQGFGVRQAGKEGAVDADTVFQLASVSKPMTSTVLAALVGEGVIGWDDRVIDHDPGFRFLDPWVTRQLTLRDLLCHRSGLPDHAGDLLEDLGYGRDEVLRRLRFMKPASSFRARYAYTNFGYTAAAVAAAKAAGKPWEELAEQKLYRPLGMKSTSSRFKDYRSAANRAELHRPGLKPREWVARYVRDPDAQSPAGGVSASARDLVSWMRLQLANGKYEGKQLIAAAALDETRQPQMISGFDPVTRRVSLYGLGWNVAPDHRGQARWSHSGGFALGARTEVALLPAQNVGIAVLSNAAPTGLPEAITESFFDLLFDGKVQRDWLSLLNRLFEEEEKKDFARLADYSKPPAKPSPPLTPGAYTGRYTNVYFGDLLIDEKDGALQLRLGPARTAFALRHYDRDVFLYQPTGENATGPSGVTFRIGAGRKANTVVVEHLDRDGMGTFVRMEPGA